MALLIQRVPPDELSEVWKFVEYGLDRILEKQTEPWRPADVYAHVYSGESALYIGMTATEAVGFFVARVILEEFSNEPIIFIWCLYATDALQYEDDFNAFIDRVAQDMGINRIRWGGRRGWGRAIKTKVISKTIYERVVAQKESI